MGRVEGATSPHLCMTMATNMNRRRRRRPLETMTTMAAVVPVLALALGLATLKGVQARALLQEGKEGKASPNAITVPTPPEDTARLLNETFKVTTPEGTIEVSRGQMAWQNGFVNGRVRGRQGRERAEVSPSAVDFRLRDGGRRQEVPAPAAARARHQRRRHPRDLESPGRHGPRPGPGGRAVRPGGH